MPRHARSVAFTALALLSLILGFFPLRLEEGELIRGLLGNVASYVVFWLGLRGWGQVISRKLALKESEPAALTAIELALGSITASTSAFLFLLLSSDPFVLRIGAHLWCALGFTIGNRGFLRLLPRSRAARAPYAMFCFAIFLTFLGSINPAPHGDALVAYALAPRLWYEAGGFAPFLENPITFLASLWDSMGAFGNFFHGGPAGAGLAEAHRFSQWLTAGIAVPGIAFATVGLLAGRLPTGGREFWLWIAALAAISVPGLRWMGGLAKHDLGAAFWALTGLLLVLRHSSSCAGLFAAGLTLGAACSAKPPYGVFALPISAWALYRNPRAFLFLALGGALAVLPIGVRNFAMTGNPLYPWLNSFFGSTLAGPDLERGFSGATGALQRPTLTRWVELLRQIAFHSAWIPFSAILFFHRPLRPLALLGWGTAVAFCILIFASTELRYAGPILILLSGLGITGILFLLERALSRVPRVRSGAFALFGFIVVLLADFTFFLVLRINSRHLKPPAEVVLKHFGGSAKAWLRVHSRPEDRVLSIGDNEVYYALPARLHEVRFHPVYDRAFDPIQTPGEAVDTMKRLGIRYYYRAPVTPSPGSHRYLGLLDQAVIGQERCRVFQDGAAAIYEVACLESAPKR